MRIVCEGIDIPYGMVGIRADGDEVYLCSQYGNKMRGLKRFYTHTEALLLAKAIREAYENGEKVFNVDEYE